MQNSVITYIMINRKSRKLISRPVASLINWDRMLNDGDMCLFHL